MENHWPAPIVDQNQRGTGLVSWKQPSAQPHRHSAVPVSFMHASKRCCFFYYKSAIKNNIAQVNIHTNPPQLNSQEYSDQRIFMSNTQTNMLNSYMLSI